MQSQACVQVLDRSPRCTFEFMIVMMWNTGRCLVLYSSKAPLSGLPPKFCRKTHAKVRHRKAIAHNQRLRIISCTTESIAVPYLLLVDMRANYHVHPGRTQYRRYCGACTTVTVHFVHFFYGEVVGSAEILYRNEDHRKRALNVLQEKVR